MDWIHCNNCARQPRTRDPDFVMTTCGHIFCKRCESRENIEQCLVCKAKTKVTPLVARNMRPEIRVYFEELEKSINSIVELASTVSNVYKFQKKHRTGFFKIQTRKIDGYNRLKQENNLLRKKYAELLKENETLKRKEHNQLLHQGTPKMHHQSPHPRASGQTSTSFSNPHTPVQDVYDNTHAAFGYIQPHLKNHASYRNNVQQRTPVYRPNSSVAGSAASSNFANQFQRQVASSGFARPQETPSALRGSQIRGPTPLYNAMKGMKINEAAMRRNRK